MSTTFGNLPADVIDEILIHLPINEHLQSIGLASKTQLAPFMFKSLPYSKHHVSHQIKLLNRGNVWDFLSGSGIYGYGWTVLPLTYKAAIYKEIMSASVWAETNADYEAVIHLPTDRYGFDLSDAETDKRMSFRWPLDPKQRLAIFNLLIDNGFGKESGWNYAIQMAAYENHVDAIRIVLGHPSIRVNSSVNNNFLIRRASEMGYADIVRFLLGIPGVNPAVNSNFCVRKAVEYGWHEVAGILLKDHRVNASAGNDFCLRKAVGNQDARMVKMLLDIGQLNPSIAISTTCFKTAVENELFDIARLLLDARIFMNPAASDNYILKLVVSQGHVEFVDALLLDERVICNMTQEAIHQSREDAKSARESSFYEETM